MKSLGLWVRTLGTRSDRRHIFITGAPRSGTTLVKTILTAHSAIAGGDYESTGFFKPRNLYQYSCGEIKNGWIQISPEEASSVVDLYDQLAEALLGWYGGEHFVDKVWPHTYRLKFVVAKFPRARWVHMIRDGRDSYCSAREHPNIPQSASLDQFARYWRDANKLVDRYIPTDKRIQLRYEDLTRSPEDEIQRLMDFLRLPVQTGQFHPAESGRIPSIRKREHHRRLTQPLDTRSVGRSTEELGEHERKRFFGIAGDMLQQYRYM